MSSDTIFTIFVLVVFVTITVFTIIGGIKEGRESMKKLNEHLDMKERQKADTNHQY